MGEEGEREGDRIGEDQRRRREGGIREYSCTKISTEEKGAQCSSGGPS